MLGLLRVILKVKIITEKLFKRWLSYTVHQNGLWERWTLTVCSYLYLAYKNSAVKSKKNIAIMNIE